VWLVHGDDNLTAIYERARALSLSIFHMI
jgi:hypothetical protein